MISRANSNHEQSPEFVVCTIPRAPLRHNLMIARAKSTEYVGHPRWSLTTSKAGRLAASFKIVSGKHFPPIPNNHEVRATQQSGSASHKRTSASAFDRP